METKLLNIAKRLGVIFLYVPFITVIFILAIVFIQIPYWFINGENFMVEKMADFAIRCYEPFERH
jgi:hypothetical protein